MMRVLFLGRKPVAAEALIHLMDQKAFEVVGVLTDSHLAVSPTADVARSLNLPIYSFSDALSAMKKGELEFDLGFSVLYWRKLRDEFLTIPSLGIINFHPAPLPEYKGTAGYNLAILEQLEEWAITAHYIDENIDTGDIIEIASFPIDAERETALTLERKSQDVLLNLLKKVAKQVVDTNGQLPTIPNIGGRYISREEMEAMKEVKPGDDVSRKIRAFWFPPYDGAYLMVGGVKCTLIDNFILEQLAGPNGSNMFKDT